MREEFSTQDMDYLKLAFKVDATREFLRGLLNAAASCKNDVRTEKEETFFKCLADLELAIKIQKTHTETQEEGYVPTLHLSTITKEKYNEKCTTGGSNKLEDWPNEVTRLHDALLTEIYNAASEVAKQEESMVKKYWPATVGLFLGGVVGTFGWDLLLTYVFKSASEVANQEKPVVKKKMWAANVEGTVGSKATQKRGNVSGGVAATLGAGLGAIAGNYFLPKIFQSKIDPKSLQSKVKNILKLQNSSTVEKTTSNQVEGQAQQLIEKNLHIWALKKINEYMRPERVLCIKAVCRLIGEHQDQEEILRGLILLLVKASNDTNGNSNKLVKAPRNITFFLLNGNANLVDKTVEQWITDHNAVSSEIKKALKDFKILPGNKQDDMSRYYKTVALLFDHKGFFVENEAIKTEVRQMRQTIKTAAQEVNRESENSV